MSSVSQKSWAVMCEGMGSLFIVQDTRAHDSLGVTVVDKQGTESHIYISPSLAADLSEWLRAWAAEQGIQP
jgi:hypothetical protein